MAGFFYQMTFIDEVAEPKAQAIRARSSPPVLKLWLWHLVLESFWTQNVLVGSSLGSPVALMLFALWLGLFALESSQGRQQQCQEMQMTSARCVKTRCLPCRWEFRDNFCSIVSVLQGVQGVTSYSTSFLFEYILK